MKISKRTFDVLKSFGALNQSIWVPAGSTKLKTKSHITEMVAIVGTEEKFETAFGFYNIGEFLNIVGLYTDPSFEFKDNHVVISEDGKPPFTRYFYISPDILEPINVSDNMKLPSTELQLNINTKQLARLIKSGKYLTSSEISFTNENSENGELFIRAFNRKSDNTFSISIPADEFEVSNKDATFNFIFDIQALKILPNDYQVSFTRAGVCEFKNTVEDVKYFIPLKKDSSYVE